MFSDESKRSIDAVGRYRSRGVLLRTSEFGESDLIVTLYTRERGRLKAFARNAKRSKKRFGTSLDLFSHIDLDLSVPKNPGSLSSLNSITTVSHFEALRKSVEKIAMASYIVELYDEMTPENVRNDELYHLLVDFLGAVDSSCVRYETLPLWGIRFLRSVGLGPDFSGCILCRRETGTNGCFFKCDRGGIVCGSCAFRDDPMNVKLSEETITILRKAQGSNENFIKRLKPGPQAAREMRRMVEKFISFHLGKRLNSSRFMEEMDNG